MANTVSLLRCSTNATMQGRRARVHTTCYYSESIVYRCVYNSIKFVMAWRLINNHETYDRSLDIVRRNLAIVFFYKLAKIINRCAKLINSSHQYVDLFCIFWISLFFELFFLYISFYLSRTFFFHSTLAIFTNRCSLVGASAKTRRKAQKKRKKKRSRRFVLRI